MAAIHGHHPRRSRSSFNRFINCCEGDTLSSGMNDYPSAGQGCNDLIVFVLAACRHNENRRTPEDQEQCEEYFRSFAVRLLTISSRAHLLQFTPPRPSRGESRNLGLKTLNFVSSGFPTPPLPLKWKFEFSQGKQRS